VRPSGIWRTGHGEPTQLALRTRDTGDDPLDLRLALVAAAAWPATLANLSRTPQDILTAGLIAAVLGPAALLSGCAATRWTARRRMSGSGPMTGRARLRVGGRTACRSWLPGRRRSGWAATVAAAAFGVALVLLPLAARVEQVRTSPLMSLARAGRAATLELVIAADPRPVPAPGFGGMARVGVEARARAVMRGPARVPVDGRLLVLAPADGWAELLPGQPLRTAGTLAPARDDQMIVVLFVNHPPELTGRPPWWQRAAGHVRADLRQAADGLPVDVRGLLPGLVDGDVSRLDPVLASRFRLAGLTHLVAVSGTNCSIVVGVVLLLRRTGARPWVRAGMGGLVLVAFVLVARPSPSVLRAAVMAAVALIALPSGRPRRAVPALSATVLVLLVWDPTLARDYGFGMSAAATAALLMLAPQWATALRARRVPPVFAESIAVAAAAHLVTAPLVACLSGQVSLVAVPANILAEPVVAPATVLGFAAAVLAPLWLTGAHVLLWLAAWPGRWLVWIADTLGGVRGAVLPWPGGAAGALVLVLLFAAGGLLVRRRAGRSALGAAALVAALVQFPGRALLAGWPPPGWLMVMCDVGQGDGLVLDAGPRTAVVVDTGPDPVAMDRCLHILGVTQVPLLVLTHFHADHVNGLDGVLHGRRVGRVVSGPLPEPDTGLALVRSLTAARGLTLSTPAVGTVFDVGAIRLNVLGPRVVLHDTHSDPNNDSLVLRASIGGTRILLPGDAEVEAQQALLEAGTDLRADVLKVAHHGSAYFVPEFLAAVQARAALISVGAHNDYGHPSPRLLSALAVLGVPVERTDRDGDVALVRNGTGLAAVKHRAAPRLALGPQLQGPPDSAPQWEFPGLSRIPPGATMVRWPRAPSTSTTCLTRCRPSYSSSATRSCSSAEPSARSPPLPGSATPGRWTPS
jgi:competence protein ComEC